MDAVQIIHDDYREIYQLLEKFIDKTFYNYAMTFQLFPTQIDFYLPLPDDEIYPVPEFIQAAILTEFFNFHGVSWYIDQFFLNSSIKDIKIKKSPIYFYHKNRLKKEYTIIPKNETNKFSQIIESACMLFQHIREKKEIEYNKGVQRYWKRRAEKKKW